MDKNIVEVIIGGQIYKIQGEESGEHIKQVAEKINKNYEEIRNSKNSARYSTVQIAMLVAMNMADSAIKIEQELKECIVDLGKCETENMALLERIEELTLEIQELKTNRKLDIF
ncbi:MAG: hypothetical protein BEN19_05335 [Epulopiscium sp. Nuni2H_MBin003]|nr:MAG: hypothetical protein BEN19_05335 [Epulopiscium sp. Nuni2H_MBin003]